MDTTGPVRLRNLQRVVASIALSLVVLAVAAFAVAPAGGAVPPWWVLPVQVLAGLAVHVACAAVGYRVAPAEPHGDEDRIAATSFARFQSATVLRLALSESIAIASLAGALVLKSGGGWVYVGGALVSLALLWRHAWPTERTITTTEASLERGGAPSYLRRALGLPDAGPIQRL